MAILAEASNDIQIDGKDKILTEIVYRGQK
jgi:hypothetical protein